MPLDALSGPTSVQPTSGLPSTNPLRQLRQDFAALGAALQSGDVTGAQSAFATYQQDLDAVQQMRAARESSAPNASASGRPPASTNFQDLLQALGSALSSGDANKAQQAFQSLQQAVGAHGHGHRHHGAHAVTASTPASSPAATGSVDTTA